MPWSVLPELQAELDAALATYDWRRARAICDRFIRLTCDEPTPCPGEDARRVLAALRKKRRLRIRRQYALALIDQGFLVAPEPILQALTARLHGEHGAVQAPAGNVTAEIAKVRSARSQLERNFGTDKTVTLHWYETGLLRTRSVARIELQRKGPGDGMARKAPSRRTRRWSTSRP